MLKGERVVLRPFKEEELSLLEDWANTREQAIGSYQPYLLGQGSQLRQRLAGRLGPTKEGGILTIEVDGQAIGFVRYSMLQFIPEHVEYYDIGYAVADPALRGKGYAGEACRLLIDYLFETYPVRRIGALVLPENEPSVRLLQGLGFICEGVLRQAIFFDGCWHELAIYGILRDDWKMRRFEPR